MTTTSPVLALNNISSGYGSIQVLHDVSLAVYSGEVVTLIGANGAGKSTLLMSIFGNPRIFSGEIVLKGNPITKVETHHISKKGIALVPEGRRLFPHMGVKENLLLGCLHSDTNLMNTDLAKVYEYFPILKERALQSAGTLSGGEQQMLAIGRALMSRPDVLLLDEPSLGLAPILVKKIFSIIQEIASAGMTIFLVEQNAHMALNIADRGYVLVNGEVEMTGTGQELLNNDEVKSAYLGD